MTPPGLNVNNDSSVDNVRLVPHGSGMAEKKEHAAVRLDPADMARVDALIPNMSTRDIKAKRSDVLRALILGSLPTFEKDHGIMPPVDMSDPMKGRKVAP